MTEQDWLACTDPTPMLTHLLADFLRQRVSERTARAMNERKLRLLAVACCRRVWHLLPDQRSRSAVEVAERYADAVASKEDVLTAKREAKKVERFMGRVTGIRFQTPKLAAVLSLSLSKTHPFLRYVPGNAACISEKKGQPDKGEEGMQCQLLRDIFGNPFRPVALNPAWRTPTIIALAQTAYEERSLPSGELDPARLSVLADALEEAGCDNAGILSHCRGAGPHARGCWPLDLILKKK